MPDPWPEDAGAGEERSLRAVLVLVLAATIIGGGVDLALDAPETWRSPHVFYEVTLMAGASGVTIWLWRRWRRSHRRLVEARHALVERAAERDAWRASAEDVLRGLGRAIDDRLAAWGLTPVEREVALLLLKGRSHKQIAFSTNRSEKTVRQHAVTVYQKSGLNGRAELAAFFLEGLPDPQGVAEKAGVSPSQWNHVAPASNSSA